MEIKKESKESINGWTAAFYVILGITVCVVCFAIETNCGNWHVYDWCVK